jgi:surface protein
MSDNEELSIGKNPNLPYDWKQIVAIDDSNFHAAINLWFDNQPEANATYGHISDWNTSAVTDMSNAFDGRTTFNEDIGRWDVSNVRNMTMMFNEAEAFNQDIGNWDVSSVLHMYRIFRKAISFNQNIGDWDVSSVITLSAAFEHASSFDQGLSNWDISSVNHLSAVFNNAVSFNHSVNDWNTSAALNMTNTFRNARSFNHGLSNWDTSKVTSMDQMFEGAFLFDQDLSDWNISSVTNMHNIFAATHALSNSNKGLIHQAFSSNSNWPYGWREYVVIDDSNFHDAVNLWFDHQAEANATYGHISDWNTSAVTDMSSAFKGRSNFNEDISGWDVSNVANMTQMFRDATNFNQDIGDWNTSSVTNLSGMFSGIISFNQDIGRWNTSSVTQMAWVFKYTRDFNQDISNWDTSSVKNFNHLFEWANAFDQDISDWNISSAQSMDWMFENSQAISDTNKGKIHKSFSRNSNWIYDWAVYANAPPHSLSLSDSNFSENLPIGSIIGAFSAIDPDENSTLSFSLNDSSGSNDHSLFHLEENGTLLTASEFDYETNASAYNLIVRATDEYGAFTEGNFTLNLLDVHETIDLGSDHNQTTPPTDHNTTTPGIIDNNSTVPVDTNGTIVVVDQNGTLPHDQNTTTPHPTPEPEYFRPLVRTGEASAITSSSATLSGIIIDDGNSPVSEKGILLSTHPLPQLGHPGTQNLPIDENSSVFEVTIDQLEPDTNYFFRAYAMNGVGTSVGTIESFETSMEGVGPHWIDALPISDAENWWINPWLGNFYIAENNGWIMHEDLGWLFVLGQPDQSIWLWKEEMGWLWTNAETYPFLYSNQSGGWLFYHGQLDGIGLFYNYDANRWQIGQ